MFLLAITLVENATHSRPLVVTQLACCVQLLCFTLNAFHVFYSNWYALFTESPLTRCWQRGQSVIYDGVLVIVSWEKNGLLDNLFLPGKKWDSIWDCEQILFPSVEEEPIIAPPLLPKIIKSPHYTPTVGLNHESFTSHLFLVFLGGSSHNPSSHYVSFKYTI